MMIRQAMGYQKRGWNVIPLWWVMDNGRCACGNLHEGDERRIGKHPILKDWKEWQTRRVTEDEINEWWGSWPNANIAVITGTISNLFVVDDDVPEDMNRYDTWTAITGGNGYHWFFTVGDLKLPSTTRKLDDHTDTRGEGGYIILPPSRNSSGQYRWMKLGEMKPVPEALVKALRGTEEGATHKPGQHTIHERGTRNSAMMHEVARLLGKGHSPGETLKLIRQWNQDWCLEPLNDKELYDCVKSMWENKEKPKREARLKDKEENPHGELIVRSGWYMMEKYLLKDDGWIIPHWLPSGTVCMMGAPPGSFKTWFLIDLAISIVSGRPFLNHYPVLRTGKVLIVQQEDNFTMLMNRMAKIMGLGEAWPDREGNFHIPMWQHDVPDFSEDRVLFIQNDLGMTGLEEYIKAHNPVLVAIDPMFSFVPLSDDFGVKAAQLINARIKKLRDEYGTSFLFVHHTRKGKDDDRLRDSLWGSQLLNACLESAMHIRKEKDKARMLLERHSKAYGEEPPLWFQWAIADGGTRIIHDLPPA